MCIENGYIYSSTGIWYESYCYYNFYMLMAAVVDMSCVYWTLPFGVNLTCWWIPFLFSHFSMVVFVFVCCVWEFNLQIRLPDFTDTWRCWFFSSLSSPQLYMYRFTQSSFWCCSSTFIYDFEYQLFFLLLFVWMLLNDVSCSEWHLFHGCNLHASILISNEEEIKHTQNFLHLQTVLSRAN